MKAVESIPEIVDREEDEPYHPPQDQQEGEEQQVAPPQFLGRLLQLTRGRQVDDKQTYDDFLIYANQAVERARIQKVAIEASYKLVGSIPPEKAANQENKNDTLLLIFDFYARIRQASSNKTFSETLLSFQTWNFSKAEVFCRDFQIIPKLLTREDLKILWEDIAKEHVLKGLGVFTVIDFTEFKDLIVRMSLWSYYKPGLKKLILTVEGFLPKPAEILQCFCTYLHLYDDEYIHHFLRTVGRKTQADYNYRSKDETNLRTKLEVRTDTNARSMKQVTRKGPKAGGGGVAGGPSKTSANSASHVNAYGEKVRTKVDIKPANPLEVINQSAKSTFQTRSEGNLTSPLKKKAPLPQVMQDRFEALKTDDRRVNYQNSAELAEGGGGGDSLFLPPPSSLENGDGGGGSPVSKTDSQKSPNKKPSPQKNSSPRARFSPVRTSNYGDESPDRDDDDDSVDYPTSSHSIEGGSTMAFHDNSFEALREIYASHYDSRLVVDLLQYCYVPPRTVVIDWIPTHGPLVDLGLLEGGMKVTINYRLVNDTGDDLFIDFTTRDFKADDTDIKTLTKPLVPGMSRVVTVTFTVPDRKITVLGFFEVYIISPRQSMKGVLPCPIFYYVDPGLERPIHPTCNAKALPDLLRQRLYCHNTPSDISTRRLTTGFQKRKAMDGTWHNSLKGMDMSQRQSTLPLSREFH